MGKEGWFFPNDTSVRVCHYGVEGRRRSLCRKHEAPEPHMFFPEVEHRKCTACTKRLEEITRRKMREKTRQLENRTDLALSAFIDHISNLLSCFEFARVERILEEIEKIPSETFEE